MADVITEATSKMKKQRLEIDRLTQKLAELGQRSRGAICCYCGEVLYTHPTVDEPTEEEIRNLIATFEEHDAKCDRNPLARRIAELEEATADNDRQRRQLQGANNREVDRRRRAEADLATMTANAEIERQNAAALTAQVEAQEKTYVEALDKIAETLGLTGDFVVLSEVLTAIDVMCLELEEWWRTAEQAVGERCGDEKHCICVPALRVLLTQERGVIAELREKLNAQLAVIHVGVGAIAVSTAYSVDDPAHVERQVVISREKNQGEVGQELPHNIGKTTDELDVLARFSIDEPDGAWSLIDAFQRAIENARRAGVGGWTVENSK